MPQAPQELSRSESESSSARSGEEKLGRQSIIRNLATIQRIAEVRPGELLRDDLSSMSRHVTGRKTDPMSGEATLGALSRKEFVTNYLATALQPSAAQEAA